MANNEEKSFPVIVGMDFGFDASKQKVIYSENSKMKKSMDIGNEEIVLKAGNITKEQFEIEKNKIKAKNKKEKTSSRTTQKNTEMYK